MPGVLPHPGRRVERSRRRLPASETLGGRAALPAPGSEPARAALPSGLPGEAVARRRRRGPGKTGSPRQAQGRSGAVRAGRKLLRRLPPQRFDADHGEG